MSAKNEPQRPEGGRQRRIKREEVRRRILNVAYSLFAERGYEGASLERVAEAAGFSKGAVYSNFANKDELFYELIAARIDERAEAVRAASVKRAAGKREGAATAARRAGEELRGMGAADPGWQMLFIEFWLRCARSEELRIKFAQRRRAMRARIAALVEEEASAAGIELGRSGAMDLATTLLALSNGLGIEGILDPPAVKPALFGEIMERIVAPTLSRDSAGGTRTSAPRRRRTR
jgi:AcrR family transcriptional regulator